MAGTSYGYNVHEFCCDKILPYHHPHTEPDTIFSTLKGAISRVSHQLHFLNSVGTQDPSIMKTAKCIQQTAQGLSHKIHCSFLHNDGHGCGRGSGGRGREQFSRTTTKEPSTGRGLPPSDASTTTAHASNVSGGSNNNPSGPPNNNNNNINNNGNTGDKTGDGDNNGSQKRQQISSGDNAKDEMVQSFTLHIPNISNYVDSTKQVIYNISEGIKQKGGSLQLVPSTDVLLRPPPITDLQNFPKEPALFKKYFKTNQTHASINKFDGNIIQVNCICLITTLEMKDLVLHFLQKYQFWMDSPDIYDGRYSNFFWVKGAHAKCTYRNIIISTLVNATNFDPNQFPP